MAKKEYGPDYWAQPDDAWQSKNDRGQGRYGADRYHDNGRYDDRHQGGDNNRYGNDADRYGNDQDRYGNDADRYGDDSARYGDDDERYGNDRDRYGNDEDYYYSDPGQPNPSDMSSSTPKSFKKATRRSSRYKVTSTVESDPDGRTVRTGFPNTRGAGGTGMPAGPSGVAGQNGKNGFGDPGHPATQTVKPAFRQAASAIVTVVVVIFVAAIGVQVWRTWSRSSGSTGASSSSSVQDDSHRSSGGSMANAVSYDAWDTITVGTGTAGATKAEAEKILGRKADNSTTSTVKGVKIERLRWNGVKGGTASYSRVNVEFQDDHAVLKSAYGLVTNRPHEITLAQYQKIVSGQGKKDVEAIVGRPDSVTVINYGTPWESWTYSTDVKGGTTASFRVVFKNGVVSTTTQSDMR